MSDEPLRIPWHGEVYTSIVEHPGTRATRYRDRWSVGLENGKSTKFFDCGHRHASWRAAERCEARLTAILRGRGRAVLRVT